MIQLQHRQQALVRITSSAVSVDTRPFEDDLSAVPDLVETMQQLSSTAIGALESLIEAADSGADICPAETFTGAPTSPICDVAFMAHWDLRQRAERLNSLISCLDPWLVIAQCASMRRHVIKSMVQVEQVLCQETDTAPQLTALHKSDLETAQATRRAYLAFIHGIRATEARLSAGKSDMSHALRLSVTSIAILIGRSVYQDLRVSDRQQLRALQGRILASAKGSVLDQIGARRLWMDISASAQLLTRVHERTELIETDFELLAEILDEDSELSVLSEGQHARLRELEGRDPDLDVLLASNKRELSHLRGGLVALHDRLAVTLGRALVGESTKVTSIVWG